MDEYVDNWDLMPDMTNGEIAPTYSFVSDIADATKLQGIQPGEVGVSWWENLLKFGATRAIDSHFKDQDAARLQQSQALGIQGANGWTVRPGVRQPLLPTTQQGWEKLAIFGVMGVALFAVMKAA